MIRDTITTTDLYAGVVLVYSEDPLILDVVESVDPPVAPAVVARVNVRRLSPNRGAQTHFFSGIGALHALATQDECEAAGLR